MPPADELPLTERVARLEAREQLRGALIAAAIAVAMAIYMAWNIGLIRLELPARG